MESFRNDNNVNNFRVISNDALTDFANLDRISESSTEQRRHTVPEFSFNQNESVRAFPSQKVLTLHDNSLTNQLLSLNQGEMQQTFTNLASSSTAEMAGGLYSINIPRTRRRSYPLNFDISIRYNNIAIPHQSWTIIPSAEEEANHFESTGLSTECNNQTIQTICRSGTNPNTMKKRQWASNKFMQWLKITNKEVRLLHHYDAKTLSSLIAEYTLFLKDKVKKDFKPRTFYETIMNLQQAINEERGYNNLPPYRFMSDPEFFMIPKLIDSSLKLVNRELGPFITKKSCDVISSEIENTLWQKHFLGHTTPTLLLNTVFYLIGLNFALRAIQEHHRLTTENFELKCINNQECLIYRENTTKNNQGGLKDLNRKRKEVTAFPNYENPDRCLVHLFKLYMSKRPSAISAFYLRPNANWKSSTWYIKMIIGRNTLSIIVKNYNERCWICWKLLKPFFTCNCCHTYVRKQYR